MYKPGGSVIHIQEGLTGVLDVDPVLGPVVLLECLKALAGKGGGGVQVGAQLRHIEVLGLVLIQGRLLIVQNWECLG
jgi:hypothetical protein